MSPVRRPAAPAVAEGPSFGRLDFYTAGGGLPEGDYALEFEIKMHQYLKQDNTPVGPTFLCVALTAYSLTDPGAEPKMTYLSMGRNAHQSFQPNPDTGKSLVAVPGGPGGRPNKSTNWALFLESLYNSGLPEGIFDNDISVLDGIWVHIQNIPEPEERKGFQAKTGEVQEERKQNQTIPVITEIKDGGAPWEGGGGIPAAEAAPAPKVAVKAGPKPVAVAKPVARVAPKAAPAPVAAETAEDDAEVTTAAINGASSVLEKSPDGCSRLALRTGTFKSVTNAVSSDMAKLVTETFFGSDEALNGLLEPLGYKAAGASVVPA